MASADPQTDPLVNHVLPWDAPRAPGRPAFRPQTGQRGAPGPRGFIGSAGPQGPAGAQGPKGPTGPPGAIGPDGDVGPTGATGEAGVPGATGPIGPRGFLLPHPADGTPGYTAFRWASITPTQMVVPMQEFPFPVRQPGFIMSHACNGFNRTLPPTLDKHPQTTGYDLTTGPTAGSCTYQVAYSPWFPASDLKMAAGGATYATIDLTFRAMFIQTPSGNQTFGPPGADISAGGRLPTLRNITHAVAYATLAYYPGHGSPGNQYPTNTNSLLGVPQNVLWTSIQEPIGHGVWPAVPSAETWLSLFPAVIPDPTNQPGIRPRHSAFNSQRGAWHQLHRPYAISDTITLDEIRRTVPLSAFNPATDFVRVELFVDMMYEPPLDTTVNPTGTSATPDATYTSRLWGDALSFYLQVNTDNGAPVSGSAWLNDRWAYLPTNTTRSGAVKPLKTDSVSGSRENNWFNLEIKAF